MRTCLLLAAVLVAGCTESAPIAADDVEITSELEDVGINVQSGFLHLTFVSAEGETTIVLTQQAATEANLQIGQMLEALQQTVDAPRSPSQVVAQRANLFVDLVEPPLRFRAAWVDR